MSASEVDPAFEQLLDYVRATRGFDYTGYKRPSLMRRFKRRMQAVGVASFEEYQAYLEEHPDEFVDLFNTILINVTTFFRDAAPWYFLAEKILPGLVERKAGEPIRVWSAGCATGQEAYTTAMLLGELMGVEALGQQVKIYATDLDEDALNVGRHARYSTNEMSEVPENLRAAYFEQTNHAFVVRNDVRRTVIFGRHDLIQDPPISRVDLLVSRNTLMYFQADTQRRILQNFHFALNPDGYLFLGKSEMLTSRTNLFESVDRPNRVFRPVAQQNALHAVQVIPGQARREVEVPVAPQLREAAYEAAPVPQLVIDLNGTFVAANHQARVAFGLTARDIGRPIQDLDVSFRPLELRSRIERAYNDRRPINERGVEWRSTDGEPRFVDVQVQPLAGPTGNLVGVSVTFNDTSRASLLEAELDQTRNTLETAYEELQSTVEELETTNEELQSTNEELETTNEELQSTNEELETMNEELQSTNEELETMNDELRLRTDELNEGNAFLGSVLANVRAGVIVVDKDLRVEEWSRRAEDLWGLSAEVVRGQNFLNLEIGLPVQQLRQPIRDALAGEADGAEIMVEAVDRRARSIRCRVRCSPLVSAGADVRGVIILMEEEGH